MKIELDEYALEVEITHLVDTPPDPTSWDSDVDYYGCRELEFAVEYGTYTDEDGAVTELTGEECDELAQDLKERIEEKIWETIYSDDLRG